MLLAWAAILIGSGQVCDAQEPDELPVIAKPDFAKPPPPKATDPPPADGGPNAYIRTPDEIIAFFEERVRRVPKDFVSYRYLGEAYERKAREHDDLASYAKAEGAFRKAVELMPKFSRAEAGLAAVLCSRHKFAEGLEIAKALYAREPKNIDALSTIGDAQLEIGRYDEAEVTFAALHKLAPIPEVVARQANLAEIQGDVDRALTLMRKAADEARKTGTALDSAWYFVRMADVAFQVGKIAEAESLYQNVLKDVPEQHDATFGLGLVRQAQGKPDEALALMERAVAIGPDPHMLMALGDLCLLANRPVEALRMTLYAAEVIAFLAVLALTLLKKPFLNLSQRDWLFQLLIFLIGPGIIVNGILKRLWGRARPFQTTDFGGQQSFTKAWQINLDGGGNSSFVSGEMAGATALAICLTMILRANQSRIGPNLYRVGLTLALSLPLITAWQRMAAGRHFLSDVVISALLIGLLAAVLHRILYGKAVA